MAERARIGFVGIGNMGWPMAANLVRAGFAVSVFDAEPARAGAFAKEFGAAAAATLRELAAADIVVTMLPTGRLVREVLVEAEGGALAASLAEGAVVVDMSSSEPVGTRELGPILAKRGVMLVDAPVSGGVPGAEKGTLSIMVGADDDALYDRVAPVLSAMGKRLFRTGGLGSGHAMKALNNYAAAAAFVAACEALIVGKRFGLDPAVMIDIMNQSTGRSFNTEFVIKDEVIPRTFTTGFKLGLMAKDVKIAGDLARSMRVKAPVSKLVSEIWADACERIGADHDFSEAIKRWEQANRVTL